MRSPCSRTERRQRTALFGIGFLGAALLAAAVVRLSTAYPVAEAAGKPADIDDSFAQAPLFYLSYAAVVPIAGGLVLLPGAPLIQILWRRRRGFAPAAAVA